MDQLTAIRAADPPAAQAFYGEALQILSASGLPFLVAGTYAVSAYTGLSRPTKDLDVFCKPGDYPRILLTFAERGYKTTVKDERWLAKVRKGRLFFDVIFNSTAAVAPVTEQWFAEKRFAELFGTRIPLVPPTELIWSKVFVQDRTRFDGADVVHLILKEHATIDWRRLLSYMEPYWEVLLQHLLNFRFVYPSERNRVPRWLLEELLERLRMQDQLPLPRMRVCRGRMFSRADYQIDIEEWGFADIVGEGEVKHG